MYLDQPNHPNEQSIESQDRKPPQILYNTRGMLRKKISNMIPFFINMRDLKLYGANKIKTYRPMSFIFPTNFMRSITKKINHKNRTTLNPNLVPKIKLSYLQSINNRKEFCLISKKMTQKYRETTLNKTTAIV